MQRMLGHAKASMTLDVYADLFDDDLDNVAANLDAAIRAAGTSMGPSRNRWTAGGGDTPDLREPWWS